MDWRSVIRVLPLVVLAAPVVVAAGVLLLMPLVVAAGDDVRAPLVVASMALVDEVVVVVLRRILAFVVVDWPVVAEGVDCPWVVDCGVVAGSCANIANANPIDSKNVFFTAPSSCPEDAVI